MFLVHFLLLAKWFPFLFFFFFFFFFFFSFNISCLFQFPGCYLLLFYLLCLRCVFCSALDILIDLLPIVCPYSMKSGRIRGFS